MTYSIGIDSGSTATKGILLADGVITRRFLVPTPFRPATAITEAWETLREGLETTPFLTLTGYGRQLVDFADKQVTEISCHGLGARFLAPATRAVIDIGGQDSKVIRLNEDGSVKNFVMNDKCSAGTGKFLEVMTNRLGLTQKELSELASQGKDVTISSMCTVFAESEVISLIGKGTSREDIAYGVVESVAVKVAQLISQLGGNHYFLTGGLCEDEYVISRLSHALNAPVESMPLARYAGAIGAALLSGE